MDDSYQQGELGDLKVLVVDDHPVNREFLHSGLSGIVGQLDLADSGTAAIECCRSQTYDVILMDWHMPQLDGLDTLNRIRDLETASAHARVVVMTADARPDERAKLLSSGFEAYLSKPMSIMQIISTLRRLFRPDGHTDEAPETYLLHDRDKEPLVDFKRALSAVHGEPGVASRLGLMLSRELEKKLPVLDQHLLDGRFSDAAELLHQWAGAGGFTGAVRFSQVCRQLQARLQADANSGIGASYTEFLRVAHATRQVLKLQQHAQPSD